ncbi:Rossmann-like and DUF2520 domain-containing protein [Viscerimonas tarda]
MKLVFIGAGNLATNLALELKKQAVPIVQIYSRTVESATILAEKSGCPATNKVEEIVPDADLYIFSVKDDALPALLKQIPANNGLWVHTAGSVPMHVFEGHVPNYGVVYPFQTFSKSRTVDFGAIPFFIEANTPENLDKLKSTFSKLSGKQIELSSEKRRQVHLTGVFACNFVNHLYAISQQLLEKEGIPFEVVLPLIDETAAKVHEMAPEKAQTGPAIRFDKTVMDKHLSLLTDSRVKALYQLISEDIHHTNNKQNELDKL